MGKFTKVPQQRTTWSPEEVKCIESGRILVDRIEKHESLVRTSKQTMKTSSRKLTDLIIRRNITKDYNHEENVFPAIINTHVLESLNWEIVQKQNELGEIVENLSNSLKSVETATNDVEKSLQSVLFEGENLSNHQRELMNLLNYILDTSLSIQAYYTSYQINLELGVELNREKNSAFEEFQGKDDAKDFSQFVNDFLCRCRLEQILRIQENDNES